jgi:hypothetical protein
MDGKEQLHKKGPPSLYLLEKIYLKLSKIIFHQEMGTQKIQGARTWEEGFIFHH